MKGELTFIYKCRRCGEGFRGVTGGKHHVFVCLFDLVSFGEVRSPGTCGHTKNLRLLELHDCHDGGYGIADMIGARS